MPEKYLSDSAENARIKLVHVFDVVYRIHVHRIKTAD
jgi:hypothetical protein